MKTLTVDALVTIYKRENQDLETEFFRTQTTFDDYVASFCKEGGYKESELTEDQIRECAYNFIEYER